MQVQAFIKSSLLTIILVLTCQGMHAAVTKTFCISGTSDGTPWTWSLSGTGLPSNTVTAPAVPNGGSATDLAQNWVRSIQAVQGRPPGYQAEFLRTDEDGTAYFTITASRNFRFDVDGCRITGNPNGCRFNPTVLDITPPPRSQQGLLWWSLVVNVLLALTLFLVLFRRRTP